MISETYLLNLYNDFTKENQDLLTNLKDLKLTDVRQPQGLCLTKPGMANQ